jgi:hypothetical protein
MTTQEKIKQVKSLFDRCQSRLPDLTEARVWLDGIGLSLHYLTGSLHNQKQPVPANEIEQWEALNSVTLPDDFKLFLQEIGAGSLDLGSAGPISPLSKLAPEFNDLADDPEEFGLAIDIANKWDGGDFNTVTLMLTGKAAGTLRFSDHMNRPGGLTFLDFAEELLTRLDYITAVTEDCQPRPLQEARAKELPEPAKLAFCAALTNRAMEAATRWWSDHPCPPPDQQETLLSAMTVLKLAARGGDVQSGEGSRIHDQVEELRQWAFKNRAVAPDCLESLAKALAWSLVLAYQAGDATAPSFSAIPRRSIPEPTVLESIPKYVLDGVDAVLGKVSDDWRETNRREIAWRQKALDLLADGKSIKDLPD